MGRFRKHHIDLMAEGKWCLKHPDRLTLQDTMEILAMLKHRGIDTNPYKRALKDFLTSKGIVVGKKIAVDIGKSKGKLSKLFVERHILNDILEWIKKQNFQAYVCDDFMFKTGTRIARALCGIQHFAMWYPLKKATEYRLIFQKEA